MARRRSDDEGSPEDSGLSILDDEDQQPAGTDDGGDVARDPEVIAREIEQTRAELTDTIDAIADKVSPKRAAERGKQAVSRSPVPVGAIAGLLAVLAVLAVVLRKRRG